MLDWPCSSPSSWRSRTDGSTHQVRLREAHLCLTVPGERSSKMRLRVIVAVVGSRRRRRRCCLRRSRAGDRSGNRADGVLRRAQLRRGRSGLPDCAGGEAERRRRLRPAPEPGCEPGLRLAYPPRSGGGDRPQRVVDLPGRGTERLPQSHVRRRSGIRGSRLRPRAPRDRGPVGGRDLLDLLPTSRLGEPSHHHRPWRSVRNRTTREVSCDGSRVSGSHREGFLTFP